MLKGLLPEIFNADMIRCATAPTSEERQAGHSCTDAHSLPEDSRACSTCAARPLQAHISAAWLTTTPDISATEIWLGHDTVLCIAVICLAV